MKGIKDIIVKGSIFAVLTAVLCMGGVPETPLVSTAHAAVEWSGNITYDNPVDPINESVTLTGDTTLTVAEGKTLTINGSIDCNEKTLTIDGPGTVTVNGGSEIYGIFLGENVTLESGTLNVTGGEGGAGIQGNVIVNGGTLTANGGTGGGTGIYGDVTMNGGELTAKGGNDGVYAGGTGIQGNVIVNGGTLTVTGGDCNSGGGFGIDGDTVTLNGGTLTATGGKRGDIISKYGLSIYDLIFVDGKKYTDGTNIYTGVLEGRDQLDPLNGKTLAPCPDAAIGADYYFTIQEALDAGDGKTVKLLRDVKTDSPLTVSKNLILDLNGHTIDRGLSGNGNIYGSVISIQSSGNLTLSDNSIDQTGLITGGNTQGAGSGVRVEGGIFTMNGGTISGNYGGSVYVDKGSFTMNNGMISNNTTDFGGGVYVYKGSFTMNNGTISNNKASYGGGVCVSGKESTFTMNNGKISNNTADYGGGVYIDSSTFTMKAGMICNNTSDYNGGGVYVTGENAAFNMTDGRISGNTSCYGGGGVYLVSGTFNMTDGEISGNTSSKKGGGVNIYSGTFNITGGEVIGNKSNSDGGGVYVNDIDMALFKITGGKIKDNTVKKNWSDVTQNVYLKNEKTITISGNLAETTIGITAETVPTIVTSGWKANMGSKDPSPYLTSDDTEYALLLNNGEIELRKAYEATVNNGDGTGSYAVGASVSIKANAPASGKQFKEWKGTDGLTFTSGSATTAEATFTMPDNAVTVEATYEDIPKVKAPTFSPDGGTYTSAQNVSISSETSGADIYYTIDGSTPTKDSRKMYTGPISVDKTMTIKAIAVKADMANSDVSSATYTINSVPPAKTYAVTVENGSGDGNYAEGTTVTIKADDPAEGKVFDKWTGDGVEFADAASPETTLKMPARAVTVTATYKDKEQVKPDPDDSGKKDDPGKKDDSGKEDDPGKDEKPVIPIPADNIVIDIPDDSPVERDSVTGEDFVNDVGGSLAEAAESLGKKEEGEERPAPSVEFNKDLSNEEINTYLNNPEKLTISVNSVSSDSLDSDASKEDAAEEAGLKLADPKAMTPSVEIKIDIYSDDGVHVGTVKKLDRGIDLKIDVSGFTEEVISIAKSFLIMSRHTPAEKWFIAGVGILDPETKTVRKTVREFSEFAVAADSREVVGIEAEDGLKADKGALDSEIEKLVKDSVKAYRLLKDGSIEYDVPGEVYSVDAKMEPGRTVSQASVAISLTVNEEYRDAYLEDPESRGTVSVELTSSEPEKPAPESADGDTAAITVTVSDNKPMDIRTETIGDYQVTYAHEIPFFGKSKPTVANFGETFTVSKGIETYKVTKIKVNKKKHLIQITGLEGADKDTVKAVKKATKGSSGLSFKVNPYYVRDTDDVTTKPKKDGSLKSVKVKINGKDYKAKKTEYDYDSTSKLITFKGENLAGSCTAK